MDKYELTIQLDGACYPKGLRTPQVWYGRLMLDEWSKDGSRLVFHAHGGPSGGAFLFELLHQPNGKYVSGTANWKLVKAVPLSQKDYLEKIHARNFGG